jgi:hypothetical protein
VAQGSVPAESSVVPLALRLMKNMSREEEEEIEESSGDDDGRKKWD